MKHIKRINEMISVDTKKFNIKNVYHVSNKDFEEFKKKQTLTIFSFQTNQLT